MKGRSRPEGQHGRSLEVGAGEWARFSAGARGSEGREEVGQKGYDGDHLWEALVPL